MIAYLLAVIFTLAFWLWFMVHDNSAWEFDDMPLKTTGLLVALSFAWPVSILIVAYAVSWDNVIKSTRRVFSRAKSFWAGLF